MVDGSMLNFMKTTDVYALFGNLMDNAIESVIKEEDDEKRIISISVKEKIREHIFILRITAMSKSHLMMDCQLQLKKTKLSWIRSKEHTLHRGSLPWNHAYENR